jgi:hypothetical protein
MAIVKMPSTPKLEKKVCKLRVSLKGTASALSSTPVLSL